LIKKEAIIKKQKERRPQSLFPVFQTTDDHGLLYFKEGRTGATRYEPVPGKYIGDLDYKKVIKFYRA
jgi:hypothetical protein